MAANPTRRNGRPIGAPFRPAVETADAATTGVKEVLVMKLSLRFALDNLFVLGAAFLAISAMAFSATVAGWLAFGVSAGLLLLAGASLGTARRTGQRIGHGLVGLVALWSLIAALIFTGPALTWLVLADAIALGVLALADLAGHEVSTENVVHRLEVTGDTHSSDLASGRVAA
jgi:hypothetical protein